MGGVLVTLFRGTLTWRLCVHIRPYRIKQGGGGRFHTYPVSHNHKEELAEVPSGRKVAC